MPGDEPPDYPGRPLAEYPDYGANPPEPAGALFTREWSPATTIRENPTRVINIRKPPEEDMPLLLDSRGNTTTASTTGTTTDNNIHWRVHTDTSCGTDGWVLYDSNAFTIDTTASTDWTGFTFRARPEEWTAGIAYQPTWAWAWNRQHKGRVFEKYQETPEQKKERQDRERRHRQARQAAENRAEELLRQYLSEEQQHQLDTHNYFELRSSSGKIYRINRGTHGNVKLLDPQSRKPVKSFCIYPKTVMPKEKGDYRQVPTPDHMLSQKVMIEHMEEEFWKTANISNVRAVA